MPRHFPDHDAELLVKLKRQRAVSRYPGEAHNLPKHPRILCSDCAVVSLSYNPAFLPFAFISRAYPPSFRHSRAIVSRLDVRVYHAGLLQIMRQGVFSQEVIAQRDDSAPPLASQMGFAGRMKARPAAALLGAKDSGVRFRKRLRRVPSLFAGRAANVNF